MTEFTTTTAAALTADQAELLESARRARRSATAFAAIVGRFGRDMPGHLAGFHEIMRDVRVTARRLQEGKVPARLPQAAPALAMAAE